MTADASRTHRSRGLALTRPACASRSQCSARSSSRNRRSFDPILPLCPEPTTDEQLTFNRVHDAFVELLARHGANDTTYPRALPWRLQRGGLVQTGAEGILRFAAGHSPEATSLRANLLQVEDQAIEAGLISASELTTVLRLLDNPNFLFAVPLLVSAWGRRDS